MRAPRLYLFDPNLKSAAGHYLGYATRVADAAETIGLETVIVASTKMAPIQTSRHVLPTLELDYWQEMCPKGDDPHDHLSKSAEVLADTLTLIQHDENISSDDVLFFP